MNNIIVQPNHKMMWAVALLFPALLLGGVNPAQAHDYYQNQNDYRDQNGDYQHYGNYHHHRGYWHQHNGARLWINLG